MQQPQPIIVAHLFPEILDRLIELLAGLSPEDWEQPTACAGWSVKDVALHLLGVDVSNLSRRRDGYTFTGGAVESWDELVALINRMNDLWVQAARRISPPLLCDLLRFVGAQMGEYFASLDPHALGGPVSWAGPGPAPVWLDLAREVTERWHHQQHIRDAVGRPGLKEPRFLAPVLDAFVRALPHTYRTVEADEGTLVALAIAGEAGGRWFLLREGGRWQLYLDVPQEPDAEVAIPQDVAWRLFTRGVGPDQARAAATMVGDPALASRALEMVSIIA